MSGPEITTYVEYLYPGAFFSEGATKPTADRDAARVAREAPEGAFAFRFFDKATACVVVDGQEIELRSGAVRGTGRFYIDAEKLSIADVEALPGDHRILLSNMRGNGWDPILRCRTGNFQPFEDGDVVISSETGVQS